MHASYILLSSSVSEDVVSEVRKLQFRAYTQSPLQLLRATAVPALSPSEKEGEIMNAQAQVISRHANA